MPFFGFLTLGFVIGGICRAIYRERGMRLIPSLIAGAIASLVGGSIIMFELSGSGFYAAISALVVLFTINAFRKKEPIFEESENKGTNLVLLE